MKPRIYLAGACAHLTWEEAMAWRLEVAPRLEAMGYDVVMPLAGEKALAGTGKLLSPLGEHGVRGCDGQTIFWRDMDLLGGCDYVLASLLGAKRVSVGTVWELAVAWARVDRPIAVVIMEPDNIHRHCFIEQGCQVVETVEQALTWFPRRAE